MVSRERRFRPATELVHGGTMRSQFAETSEAMFLTQGFVYPNAEAAEARFKGDDPGFVYSRYANPTVAMFEERMCLLEGAEASRALASGMAAVAASLLSHLKAGDHIVSARALFGSCRYIVEDLAPRYGIESTLVDGRDLGAWEQAVRPNTRAFFFETPTNPTLELVDIEAVAAIAHKAGAVVVVDNVFATPLLQRPMPLGADIVVYSATKHIDGQGRSLGGVVLADNAFINDLLQPFLRHTGPALSPMNAWLLLKGLETLDLRLQRQCESALALARWLEGRAGVRAVLYPGLDSHPQRALVQKQMRAGGTVLTLSVEGGKAAAFRFLNALRLLVISNNLGDAKSLATHPATTTHQRLGPEARAAQGIDDGMIRISVGLEDVADLEDDLARALRAV